jgi:hypothetical protein
MRPQVELIQSNESVCTEHTSANQLEEFLGCQRMWAFRKLLGIRPAKKSKWLDLGSELHWQLRCYMRGYQLDLTTEAGKRALAGLHLLPDPKDCDVVEDEAEINIDSTYLLPGVERIEIQGARDLSVAFYATPMNEVDAIVDPHWAWMLIDYKTTRGDTRKGDPWAYVKTPHELEHNIAGNMYAWDIMSNKHVDVVPARWVYFLTDEKKHPDARASDFTYRREDVKRRLKLLLEVGAEHREIVRHFKRAPFDVNELPANHARCSKFGGCPYRAETGGPCNDTRTLGAMMTQPQQPPSDIEAMLAARRNGQAAPGMPVGMGPGPAPPPMNPPSFGNAQPMAAGYASQAGPPPMAAPPPLAPPGPPQSPAQGFPGLPQSQAPSYQMAPPQAAPATTDPYPGYYQASDGQWYQKPVAAPAPAQVAPPGWQQAPHAPHLPPEAQLPPQGMPAVPSAAPALPPQTVAAEAPKRGRGRPVKADQAQATAAGLPGGIPGTGGEDLKPFPTDERAVFLRACVLCVSSGVDLSDPAKIEPQARLALQYAEQVWTYLQYTKA